MKRLACMLLLLVAALPARSQTPSSYDVPDAIAASPSAAPARLSPQVDPGSLNPLEIMASAGDALGGAYTNAAGEGTKDADRPRGLSPVLNIMLLLTVIALAPSIVLMGTCFIRILVVLGLLRQAMGTGSLPPPQVTVSLSLMATMVVMAPTVDRVYKEAVVPFRAGEITDYRTLWDKAKQPMRDFMFAQIEATGNWSSLYMVMSHRGIDVSDPSRLTRADVDMVSLVPAFMLSELRAAFMMGFRLYLPFLVIDMVIATMLISMSMMMLPPVLVTLPFKLLLFVLVDGWALVVGSLMGSFARPDVATAAVNFVLGYA